MPFLQSTCVNMDSWWDLLTVLTLVADYTVKHCFLLHFKLADFTDTYQHIKSRQLHLWWRAIPKICLYFISRLYSNRKNLMLVKYTCFTVHCQLLAWYSGRKSVFGRRTFPATHSIFSWWVTTYVGKLSAGGQPTRSTQPFILSGSINE